MSIINRLKWRYATKRFDENKKLSVSQLELLLEATALSPSSYGLQPYKILLIEDAELKSKLSKAAYHQPQMKASSHIIIFAVDTDISDEDIDVFITHIATTRNVPESDLDEYRSLMKGTIGAMSQEARMVWAARQAYIGLGQLLVTCAVEEIDACPMEGFDVDAFDEILGLKEKNLSTVVMATIGFRSSSDPYQHLPKVRKSLDDFLIKY